MVSKKKDVFDVPSPTIKEIQRLISLVVYDKLIASSTMKLSAQYEFCYKEYHGGNTDDDDTLGQGMLFLRGELHFADAFNENTVDVTNSNAVTNNERTLKALLTQDSSSVYHVGKHLTRNVICQVSKKKSDLLTGRQIIHIASIAKKNILKATAIADAYTQHTTGGPSGHNIADLYEHVLQKMYDAESLCPSDDDAEKEDQEVAQGENNANNNKSKGKSARPEKYFFPGFMGFVLFSSYSTTQGNILEILKSNNFAKGGGRVEARNKNKNDKDTERYQDSGHATVSVESPFKRGIGLDTRHKLAVLEQSETKIGQRDDENQAFILAELIKSLIATTDQCFKVAIRFGKNATTREDDESHPLWVAYFKSMAEVASTRKKLCQLKEEMSEKTRKAIAKRSLASGLLDNMENVKRAKVPPATIVKKNTKTPPTKSTMNKTVDTCVDAAASDSTVFTSGIADVRDARSIPMPRTHLEMGIPIGIAQEKVNTSSVSGECPGDILLLGSGSSNTSSPNLSSLDESI